MMRRQSPLIPDAVKFRSRKLREPSFTNIPAAGTPPSAPPRPADPSIPPLPPGMPPIPAAPLGPPGPRGMNGTNGTTAASEAAPSLLPFNGPGGATIGPSQLASSTAASAELTILIHPPGFFTTSSCPGRLLAWPRDLVLVQAQHQRAAGD